jgi:Protein of unknown function (DUF2971)
MTQTTYITEAHREEYRKFCAHHIRSFGQSAVNEVWHYTNADGLIGMLKSGEIYTTQIACLNDSLEYRYFGDVVHKVIREKLKSPADPDILAFLRVADEGLATSDYSAEGHFVACFSEVEDDLSQWRGYGGGECGYSIGFRFDGLMEAVNARPNTWLVPMNYDDPKHQFLAGDVVRMGIKYFSDGVQPQQSGFDLATWGKELTIAFAAELSIFASIIKHPKFDGEKERRIATRLQTGEHKALEFRQKRTLLARHLPISLKTDGLGRSRLPITRIYVGPGPAKRVSKISVGDLLLKYGYEGVPVEESQVPYRVP